MECNTSQNENDTGTKGIQSAIDEHSNTLYCITDLQILYTDKELYINNSVMWICMNFHQTVSSADRKVVQGHNS